MQTTNVSTATATAPKRRGRPQKKVPAPVVNKEIIKEDNVEVEQQMSPEERNLLDHLENYQSESFDILSSYFEGKPLERLARHQLESYNNFVNYQMQRTIEMFNPITIKADSEYDQESDTYGLVVKIYLRNLRFQHPQIYENNGAMKTMLPQEARLRNFTYASSAIMDLHIEYVIRDELNNVKIETKVIPKIKLCNLPVMLKSSICVLKQYNNNTVTGECPMDCGGYFIINGNEKVIVGQEQIAPNKTYVFANSKNQLDIVMGEYLLMGLLLKIQFAKSTGAIIKLGSWLVDIPNLLGLCKS